jgi:hypothetical protein
MIICSAHGGTGTVFLVQVSLFAFCSTVPLILFTNSRVVFGNDIVIKLLYFAFMAGMNKFQVSGCCGN